MLRLRVSDPDRTIAQRELRNRISEVLREVESGATIRVTVDGRPVADLRPIPRRQWVPGTEILQMLREFPVDPGFAHDVQGLDEPVEATDPWPS
jgi:prevent-host-death family protein